MTSTSNSSRPWGLDARDRAALIQNQSEQIFDFLVIGGGITGAAVARDAASRGLRVALIDQKDFSYGTSSRSSKLIHGGLRYLENFEFRLVFEALSERALLLKTQPHWVRPQSFVLPVYADDRVGMNKLSAGMWLYDIFSRFQMKKIHRRRGPQKTVQDLPFLKSGGLKGSFEYYDATMWDDTMVLDILGEARRLGAVPVSYVKALKPELDPVTRQARGFWVKDQLPEGGAGREYLVRARVVISCVGPWTDLLMAGADRNWKPRLKPSQGIHLVFPWERIPLESAVVMSNPKDGRISFVIPRKDYGKGITIVGTTDDPIAGAEGIERPEPSKEESQYLMRLLQEYLPGLRLTEADILSFYVGVRPLVDPGTASSLQKISREHTIETSAQGIVWVAGGKYTTHRVMGREIVDHAVQENADVWRRAGLSKTKSAPYPAVHERLPKTADTLEIFYGTDAPLVRKWDQDLREMFSGLPESEHFPFWRGELLYAARKRAVLVPSDFLMRRLPFHLLEIDFGQRFVPGVSQILAGELGGSDAQLNAEGDGAMAFHRQQFEKIRR